MAREVVNLPRHQYCVVHGMCMESWSSWDHALAAEEAFARGKGQHLCRTWSNLIAGGASLSGGVNPQTDHLPVLISLQSLECK